MLKSISFSNLFTFATKQTISFDSKVKVYAIIGPNASGKSCLLDVIECVTNSLWNKPRYNQLRKIVNHNTTSDIIWAECEFEYKGNEYQYTIEIDTLNERYIYQALKSQNQQLTIFEFNGTEIKSEILEQTHLDLLHTLNITKHGIFSYIDLLGDDSKISLIKGIRNLAKIQDYVKINAEHLEPKHLEKIVHFLNTCDIPVRKIEAIPFELQIQKKVQATRQDRHDPSSNPHKKKYQITFTYDNYTINLEEESRGVIWLFEFCLEVLVYNSQTYFFPRVIDDLNAHLHNHLFAYVIDTYAKYMNRQLIFTTQSQYILEHKLLPKESIIVVEKGVENSTVQKLSDIKALRSDSRHNWYSMYNQGKFGGLPHIQSTNLNLHDTSN